MLSPKIQKLVDILSRYPGLGPRQATRIVFFMIREGKNEIEELVQAAKDLEDVKICPNCFFPFFGSENLCPICRDENRDKKTIAIVEKETDLVSLEESGVFKGTYFVLGELSKKGVLEPLQRLALNSLKQRIKKELGGKVKEIILCFSPSTYGNFTSSLIKEELKDYAEKITHLSQGLPTGGEIEFADKNTLKGAFENRR